MATKTMTTKTRWNIENSDSPVMTVLSRCDLGPDPEDPSQMLAVSGLTGHGLDPLRQQARQALMAACETDGELVGSTAARRTPASWSCSPNMAPGQ